MVDDERLRRVFQSAPAIAGERDEVPSKAYAWVYVFQSAPAIAGERDGGLL